MPSGLYSAFLQLAFSVNLKMLTSRRKNFGTRKVFSQGKELLETLLIFNNLLTVNTATG